MQHSSLDNSLWQTCLKVQLQYIPSGVVLAHCMSARKGFAHLQQPSVPRSGVPWAWAIHAAAQTSGQLPGAGQLLLQLLGTPARTPLETDARQTCAATACMHADLSHFAFSLVRHPSSCYLIYAWAQHSSPNMFGMPGISSCCMHSYSPVMLHSVQ